MAKKQTHNWVPKSVPFGEYVCGMCGQTKTDQAVYTNCPGLTIRQ